MSWGEVKKVNSDLSTSLDVVMKLNHIDLIGSAYTPSIEDSITLLQSSSIYSTTVALNVVSNSFWGYIATSPNNIGNYLATTFSIDNSALKTIQTFSQLLNSPEGLFEIGNSYKAYKTIVGTNTVYETLLNTSNSPYVRGMLYNPTVFQDAFLTSANNPKLLSAYRIRSIQNSLNAVRTATELYTSGSGSYTFDSNVSGAFIVCIGGGGGGAGGNSNFVSYRPSGAGGYACGFNGGSSVSVNSRGGAGGSGGGIAQAFITPNYSHTYNYSVGIPGVGGDMTNGAVAGSGGNTYFANDVIGFTTTNRINSNYNYIASSDGGYYSLIPYDSMGNSGINGGKASSWVANNLFSTSPGGGWGGGNGVGGCNATPGIGGRTLSDTEGAGGGYAASRGGGSGGGFGGGGMGGSSVGTTGNNGGNGCIAIIKGLPFSSL